MSVESVLQTIGKDVKSVFAWLGSAAGQKTIATGEAIAEAAGVPAGLIDIANVGLTQIIQLEALAAGAGQQNGSGEQKLAAVVTAVTPQILAYAKQYGLPTPTSAQIQTIVNSLVVFANALAGKS